MVTSGAYLPVSAGTARKTRLTVGWRPCADTYAGLSDYDAMLEDLNVPIAEARRKTEEGRVRDPVRENVLIK